MRKTKQILSFEEFLVESDSNIERSLKGMGKFGIVNKEELPSPLIDEISDMGFKKMDQIKSGLDNVISDQIYHKAYDSKNRPDHHEITIFIDDHRPNDIGVSFWHNYSSNGFMIFFKWHHYNKVIEFLNDYFFDGFEYLIKDKDSYQKVKESIQDSLKKYDSTRVEFDINY